MSSRWRLEPMNAGHLPEVLAIEKASFSSPWPGEAFLPGASHAAWARSYVLLDDDDEGREVQGYVCFWMLGEEMEVQNIAVKPEARRRGGGRHLMERALEEGRRSGCLRALLEVRPSNKAALGLYALWGFEPLGRRKAYYDDGEDALVMVADLRGVPGRPGGRQAFLKGRRNG